jgi:hypothetical protein
MRETFRRPSGPFDATRRQTPSAARMVGVLELTEHVAGIRPAATPLDPISAAARFQVPAAAATDFAREAAGVERPSGLDFRLAENSSQERFSGAVQRNSQAGRVLRPEIRAAPVGAGAGRATTRWRRRKIAMVAVRSTSGRPTEDVRTTGVCAGFVDSVGDKGISSCYRERPKAAAS